MVELPDEGLDFDDPPAEQTEPPLPLAPRTPQTRILARPRRGRVGAIFREYLLDHSGYHTRILGRVKGILHIGSVG